MSQSKNQTQLNESLSALVDDEASEFEVHRLLAAAQENTDIRKRWHRYQVARAALKGDIVDMATTQFADRIRNAIADVDLDESLPSDHAAASGGNSTAAKTPPARRWKAHAGRAAIAASFAAAVLVGSQQLNLIAFNDDAATEDFAQQALEPAPSAPTSVNIPTINVQNVSGGDTFPQRSQLPQSRQYSPNVQQQQLQDEQIRRYIRQLMLEHAENSAQNSGSGLLPYARVPTEEDR